MFKPLLIVLLLAAQWFCLLAGGLMLLMAASIQSGLGAIESLVFIVPGVLLMGLRRIARMAA